MMNKKIDKQWFKVAIKDAGFKNMSEFSQFVHLDSTKLSNILSGIRRIRPNEIDNFSFALNKTPSQIREALGEELIQAPPVLPLSGYVGAADRVVIYENGSDLIDEEVHVPFFYYKGIVLEIRGESMLPRYNPGEIVGITIPNDHCVPSSLMGKDVVAYLPDERLVLKILHPGSEKGKYTLVSLNPQIPPIVDTDIIWVTNIDFLIPKARYSR